MVNLKTNSEVAFARKTLAEAGFRATVRKHEGGHRVWKVEARNKVEELGIMANKKEVASNKTPLWSEHTRLSKAVLELNDLNETHGVEMRGGKKYLMVKDRVEVFVNTLVWI